MVLGGRVLPSLSPLVLFLHRAINNDSPVLFPFESTMPLIKTVDDNPFSILFSSPPFTSSFPQYYSLTIRVWTTVAALRTHFPLHLPLFASRSGSGVLFWSIAWNKDKKQGLACVSAIYAPGSTRSRIDNHARPRMLTQTCTTSLQGQVSFINGHHRASC